MCFSLPSSLSRGHGETPPNSSCLRFNCSLQIITLIQWSLNAASVAHGYGRHMVYLSPKQLMHINKYQFYSFTLWDFALPLVKMSIACLLFRLKRDTLRWRIFLFSMIAIQLGLAITSVSFTLSLVHPIRAWWDPAGNPGAKYLSQRVMNIFLYTQAGVNITTDLLFSLLPITFISRMNQPVRTRIVICFLLALGLLTTAIGAYRIFLIWQFGTNPVQDPTWANSRVTIWCVLEGSVGIIAACIPCLKRLVELLLVKLGFMSTFADESGASNDAYSKKARMSGYQDPVLKSWHESDEGEARGVDRNSDDATRTDSNKEPWVSNEGVGELP
jgi:hypothetical protein